MRQLITGGEEVELLQSIWSIVHAGLELLPGRVQAAGLLGPFWPTPVPPGIWVSVIELMFQLTYPAAVVRGSNPLTCGKGPAWVVLPLYSAQVLEGLPAAATKGAGKG